ncbi:MAG TPA: efflux RND transporter periplasmic adaptor subunit [Gemmatimonadales bacterium]
MIPRASSSALWLLAAGCGAAAAPPPEEPADPGAPTVAVESVTVAVPLSIPAQLYVERDAIVHARSAGTVEWLGVDLGARVGAGQVLARLESTDQEIAAARADEAFAVAERAAARQRELTLRGVSTTADSEQVEAALNRALLDRRQARRNLELTRVTAPFAGVVSARFARAGRLVQDGDSLFRVTALAPLLISVQVPERQAGNLGVGSSAEVLGAEGAGKARVIRAGPVIDAASGTREFVLQVTEGQGLRPGGGAEVRLGSERRTALVLPSDAVGPEGSVLVVENGRPTARAVTFGAELGDGRVEVLAGLGAGERVVRAGR